jgi:mycothiol system anti-sigma-R factor
MTCDDVSNFLHSYLDGELDEAERVPIDRHLAGCARCRELVSFHSTVKTALRARMRRPQVPAGLRARISVALDRADAVGEGPGRRRFLRAMPVGATVAAAAVVMIFLGGSMQSHADSPIVEEAIRAHEKNLPIEVGGTEEKVKSWMVGRVPVAMRLPRMRGLVGGRMWHIDRREAAQLQYDVNGRRVTVIMFDASGLPMTGPSTRYVGRRQIFVGGRRGYSVVWYRDRDVAYTFASDLDPDRMVELVSASLRD